MNKPKFYILLVIAIIIFSQTIAFADSVVIPTRSKVTFNGLLTDFEAYTIEGANYFKLRDIAIMANKTTKQFQVTWDASKKAINLVSGSPYTPVGDEMTNGKGIYQIGIVNSAVIYKDGKIIKLTSYTIDGNNFFKLRDLGQAFNFGVTWDYESSSVAIDTTKNYKDQESTIKTIKTDWYTYIGEVKDGLLNGKGTITFANGEIYVGEFLNSQYSGQGTYTFPDGEQHVGGYLKDKRSGHGILNLPNGEKYEGEFLNGKRNGKGTYIWPDGTKYVGEWVDGYRTGQGTMFYETGNKYVGEWLIDLYNGQGIMYLSNGEIFFEGVWYNGQPAIPK